MQAGKPIVTYGEFLSSMDYNTAPSSAEVNDVIAAVLNGTDCVYLDVTTRSMHKQHCVQYASFVCRQGEAILQDQRSYVGVHDEVSAGQTWRLFTSNVPYEFHE